VSVALKDQVESTDVKRQDLPPSTSTRKKPRPRTDGGVGSPCRVVKMFLFDSPRSYNGRQRANHVADAPVRDESWGTGEGTI
jgi:hypothetical protein